MVLKDVWLIASVTSRSEALGIPTLLCAPPKDTDEELYDSGYGDSRGYYSDGVYVSRQALGVATDFDDFAYEQGDDDIVQEVDPQVAHHKSLIQRFEKLRQKLKSLPSHPIPTVPGSRPMEVDHNKSMRAEVASWSHVLFSAPPKLAQLAAMSHYTVHWLLSHLPTLMNRAKWTGGESGGEGGKGRNLGYWIWGLLAKLDDVGLLSSEEVSVVRVLAKRAGSMILGLDIELDERPNEDDLNDHGDAGPSEEVVLQEQVQDGDAEVDALDEDGHDELEGARQGAFAETSNVPEDEPSLRRRNSSSNIDDDEAFETRRLLAEAKARLLARTAPADAQANEDGEAIPVQELDASDGLTGESSMKGTLDMILTIAGECYGQRDLLVARDRLWENVADGE